LLSGVVCHRGWQGDHAGAPISPTAGHGRPAVVTDAGSGPRDWPTDGRIWMASGSRLRVVAVAGRGSRAGRRALADRVDPISRAGGQEVPEDLADRVAAARRRTSADRNRCCGGKRIRPALRRSRLKCSIGNIIFGWTHDQHVNRIQQTSDSLVLTYGYMDYVRTVHMNAQRPKNIQPTIGGHSIGSWTAMFWLWIRSDSRPACLIPIGGLQFSAQMHVVSASRSIPRRTR